MEAAMEFE